MKLTRKQLRRLIKESVLNENVDHINKLITLIESGDSTSITQALIYAEQLDYISNVQEDFHGVEEFLGDHFKMISVTFDADPQFGSAFREAHMSERGGFGGYRLKIYHVSINLPTPENQNYQIGFFFNVPYDPNL